MTISLEYIGAAERYFETASTGKSQSWRRGQTQDVSDTDAALLMATGLFAYGGADAQAASNIAPGKPVTATTNLTGGIEIVFGPDTIHTVGLRHLPIRGVIGMDSIGEQTSGGPTNVEFIDTVFPATGNINSFGFNVTQSAVRHYYPLFELVGDVGIGGQTTTQMLARDNLAYSTTRKSISDSIDLAPHVAILSAGVNNLSSITPGTYASIVATCYSEHVAIINRYLTGRVRVIDEGIFGYSASTATYPDLVRAALLELNAMFAAFAKVTPGVAYIPSPLCDKNGNFIAGVSTDGIHPNLNGGNIRGAGIGKALILLFGRCDSARFAGKNLTPNPLFSATGAQSYGKVATGVTIGYSNVTLSNAKIEARKGRLFQLVDAAPTATGNLVTMTIALDPSTWAKSAGDILEYEIDLLLESLDGSSGPPAPTDFYIRLDLQKTGAGKIYATEFASRYAAVRDPIDGHVSYKVKLPEASSVIGVAQIYLKFQTDSLAGYRVGISAPRII